MKDNTIVLLAGVIGLSALSGVAMFTSLVELAAVGVGALAGLIGGHLNGSHTS
jgi:hypothetical protein